MTHFHGALGIFSLWWPPQILAKSLPPLLFGTEVVADWRGTLLHHEQLGHVRLIFFQRLTRPLDTFILSVISPNLPFSFLLKINLTLCAGLFHNTLSLAVHYNNWNSTWETFTGEDGHYMRHTHRHNRNTHSSKLKTDIEEEIRK